MRSPGEEIAFPHPHHAPALFLQSARYQPIALTIALQLCRPPLRAIFWQRGVLRLCAAVPEATIDKDRDTFLSKNKIRFPKHFLAPPPACDPMHAKELHESKLGVAVSV